MQLTYVLCSVMATIGATCSGQCSGRRPDDASKEHVVLVQRTASLLSMNGNAPAPAPAPAAAPQAGYLGCYWEPWAMKNNYPQGLDLFVSKGTGKSLDECRSACIEYRYFGRRGMGECWCGNTYASYGKNDVQCDCAATDGATKLAENSNCIYLSQACSSFATEAACPAEATIILDGIPPSISGGKQPISSRCTWKDGACTASPVIDIGSYSCAKNWFWGDNPPVCVPETEIKKCLKVADPVTCAPDSGSHSKKVSTHTQNDHYMVSQNGGSEVCVERGDRALRGPESAANWGGYLQINCELAPTPAPAPAAPLAPAGQAASTAVGDPHLVNSRGQHFSIYETGAFEFIRVPFESTAENAEFVTQAIIESFGETDDECKAAQYITGLHFSGSKFHGKQLDVKVDFIHPGATRKEIKVWLGGVEVKPSADPIEVGDKMKLDMHNSKELVLHVNEATVAVNLQYYFLNVDANSFSNLASKIGGLLGEDDHASYSMKPAGCARKLASSAEPMVFSSARMAA